MRYLLVLFLALTPTFGDEADQTLISSNNLFTATVYNEVAKNGESNFLVSPFSAETALAFAQSGAKGQTQQELRSGLHLPDDQSKIEASFKSLLPKLKSDNFYSFRSANKLYLKENFSIKDEFKKVATEVFNSELENIEFSPRSAEAAETMNKWVEKQTENKIKNLISPNKVTENTVAILINALYFKGSWAHPFSKYLSRKSDFYQIDRSVAQVDMMYKFDREQTYNYAENAELGAQFLELPFQGKDASIVFVLPKEENGISKLEKQVSKVFLEQDFSKEYVNMSLPKFKIETKVDFKQLLQNLGVRKPFNSEADFGGITDEAILISDVIQKTYIDLNEDGVEAAAATYADVVNYIAVVISAGPKQFHVDHSFIYYIKIKKMVVFVGRVGLPSY